MQAATHAYNAMRPEEEKGVVCAGIGFGEMLRIGDTDVFGAEVNAACKLWRRHRQVRGNLLTGAALAAARLPTGVTSELINEVPPGAQSGAVALLSLPNSSVRNSSAARETQMHMSPTVALVRAQSHVAMFRHAHEHFYRTRATLPGAAGFGAAMPACLQQRSRIDSCGAT